MARKPAVKTAARSLPQSKEEVDKQVARVGEIQRQLETVRINLDEAIAAAKVKAVAEAGPLESEMAKLVDGISAYCEVHRGELTDGGRIKTVKLRNGELRWRLTPPAVTLRNVKQIVVNLKGLGLNRFIRIKEEVDKEAMLREPELAKSIRGVSITQREEFVVVPAETQVEAIRKRR